MITFVILGIALYLLAQAYQFVSHDNIIKRTKKCKYCRKRVNVKVSVLRRRKSLSVAIAGR